MTVTMLLVIGLLVQVNTFTVNEEVACKADPLRANKAPAYAAEVTDFTDDVYEIGNSALWITTGGVPSLYEIILLRGGNTYKAHAIGSDLSITNQTYTSPTTTELLDVVDHIIFVKEYSAGLQSFKFAAYLFDASNLASSTLKRVQIDPLTFPADDKRVGLRFNKVLGYDEISNTLYVVMSNSGSTEIHSKVLTTDGPFDTQIPVVDSSSSISVGNSKLLFDSTNKKYYKFSTAGNPFDVVPIKTALKGAFGPVLYANLKQYRLMKDTFVITSQEGASGSIKASFGVFELDQMISSGDDNAGTGTFTPVVHYNQYNFIFISENLFSFNRYNSKLIFSNSEISSLTAAELTEAKNDFKNGFRVSFNAEKQFILSDKNIMIYQISYNTAGTAVSKMNKLASLQLSQEVSDMIMDDSSKWIKLRIKCSCAKVLVTKLKCFSNRFKCLGINSYIPDDCSVPYADKVPEFAAA